MNDRITIDPNICHGKPTIKGTRVLVANVLGALASGESMQEILEDYPNITEEDIKAALAFSSELSNFESQSYEITAA